MLMHIVMWKLKDENKEENMDKFKEMLLNLKPIIPEINHMEVGKDTGHNEGNFDMVLVSEFKSAQDLQTYKTHPNHVVASQFCSSIRTERKCVDYEI